MDDAAPVLVMLGLFFAITAAIIVNAWRKVKEREALHKERLKAIEMGQTELPRALLDSQEDLRGKRGRGTAVHGLVWTGIGLGLLVSTTALRGEAQDTDFRQFLIFLKIWAFPSLFVGLGLLAYALMYPNGKSSTSGPAPTPK